MGTFWVGLAARLLCAPFLLQWFHPDERQILEFAHFHAHGRLHPFLESQLHLRNQTVPWLFSWLIRGLDLLTGAVGGQAGWTEPRLVLLVFHALIGVWSWWGFWSLIQWLRETAGPAGSRGVTWFGWFLALFWAFPMLYSRQLSEVLALTPTIWLFLAMQRRKFKTAGFWAGWAALLRYPGALWIFGAVLVALRPRDGNRWGRVEFTGAALGFGVAVFLGGLADWSVYGQFLGSAPAYWAFNRPHGPAEAIFGVDSLAVYWRWFEYLFSPVLAPVFLAGAAWGLVRDRTLLYFVLPYLLGHLLTPHREPRFMLPLTPFLVLAFWQALQSGRLVQAEWKSARLRKWSAVAASAFILVNFLWYPLYLGGQWVSGQGVLIRNFKNLARVPTALLLGGEAVHGPMIDALVPANALWADLERCQWERADNGPPPLRTLFLARVAPSEGACRPWPDASVGDISRFFHRGPWARLARVQVADLWECADSAAALRAGCRNGLSSPKGGSK